MRGLLLVAVGLAGCKKDSGLVDDYVSDPILPYDQLEWVDPFIATGGIGAMTTGLSPGACAPFGMTLVGPDTRHHVGGAPDFYHFGGYHYDDDRIDGFSHTHSHGMGVNDYGGLLVMARDGWDPAYTTDPGRTAPFSHDTEWASPGRYAVDLLDQDIHVEIVATERGAHHVYDFSTGAEPVVLIDLGHALSDSITIDEASLEVDLAAGEISGMQRLSGAYSGRYGGALHHFVARIDPLPVAVGAWSDPDSPQSDVSACSGSTCGAWVELPAGTTEVHVRLAMSYVDVDGARANLEAELPDLDQAARLEEVETLWRDKLGRVRVRGASSGEKRAFHTAHYHSMIFPSRQEDVDGRYRGVDQEIHTVDHPYYSDLSMWDTFRTAHPWYVLTDPEAQRDFAQSIVQMTEDGGSVPRWPLSHGYTGGMVGSPADQIWAGTVLKGIVDWDHERALDMALVHATGTQPDVNRGGINGYLERGWVAWEDNSAPASNTLEFAWSDHALAEWADFVGRPEADQLRAQSGNWSNTWDAETSMFRGRHADGSFDPPIDREVWQDDFIEGNSWHYLWYVPYDVDGMIELQHGGDRQAFLTKLEQYWLDVANEEDDLLPDDYYWHGNEPVLHYASLGSLAGNNAISADASRWVLENRYDDTPLGLDGNDDGGTLSSWYLFSAIGLYPVAGTDRYAITSPIFERVEIDRPDGTQVIVAPRASESTRYVQRIEAAGQKLQSPVITHEQLTAGELWLTMTPSREDAMR